MKAGRVIIRAIWVGSHEPLDSVPLESVGARWVRQEAAQQGKQKNQTTRVHTWYKACVRNDQHINGVLEIGGRVERGIL